MSEDDEVIVAELSEPVRAALDEAVRLVESLLEDLTETTRGGTPVMSEIRIPPLVQLRRLLLSIVGLIAAAVAAQVPELQRYLKIREM